MPGFAEIIVILVVIFIVIGAGKLPNIAIGMVKLVEKFQGRKTSDNDQTQ